MRYVLVAVFALFTANPVFVLAQTEPARPVVLPNETILRVKGQGFAAVQPQRMTFEIGVETTGATISQALDSNNRKLAPIIEALRSQGSDPADIQTSGLTVDPQYSEASDRSEERIIGFRVRNSLAVTSRDIQVAGALVSLLFEAGANSIDGPDFLVAEENEERLTRLAEADALCEARAQADVVAGAPGMKVSRILLVSESRVNFRSGSGYIIVTASKIANTPIEPGEVKVTAEYDVEFALVPG